MSAFRIDASYTWPEGENGSRILVSSGNVELRFDLDGEEIVGGGKLLVKRRKRRPLRVERAECCREKSRTKAAAVPFRAFPSAASARSI